MMLGEGLYHRENLLRDVDTSVGGMDLFRRWFSQRNQGTPMSNIWDFDVGKLVVPSVFWDVDLLVTLAKRYDPLTRIVSNFAGDRLFAISSSLIRKVFGLSKNNALLERIDLSQLQSTYEAQALYLRAGPLKEHFVKIGRLCLVTSATPEPLMKKFFV